jgi:two-component sensor histidine kinase
MTSSVELVRLNDVSDHRPTTRISTQRFAFDLNTMVPLGLLLNELITNSFKHAFKGRNEGHINLSIRNAHRMAPMISMYSDDGVGIPCGEDASRTDRRWSVAHRELRGATERPNDRGWTGRQRNYHIRFCDR